MKYHTAPKKGRRAQTKIKLFQKNTIETLHAPEEGEFIMGSGIGVLTGDKIPEPEPIKPRAAKPAADCEMNPADGEVERASAATAREELEKTQEFVIVGRQPYAAPEPAKPKKRGRAKKLAACIGIVLLLAAAACVVIAEPWVEPEPEEYDGPAEQSIGPVELAVGETASLGIELSKNEKITAVDLDGELLHYNGDGSVTALCEYFSTYATVKTREAELPAEAEKREVVILGRDLSDEYAELRAKLRDRFGIEKISKPRTELRELRVITVKIIIKGVPHTDVSAVQEIKVGKTLELTVPDVDRESGQVVLAQSADEELLTTAVVDYYRRGYDISARGVSKGDTSVTACAGYWKAVDPEEYARYLQSDLAASSPELRENEIFTKCFDVTWQISVVPKNSMSYQKKQSGGS